MNRVSHDYWPVYVLDEDGDIVVDDDLRDRLRDAWSKFEAVQDEINSQYEKVSREQRAKKEHEDSVSFVQRQRPWWSRERCEALVLSRSRSGKPLVQRVPL